MPDPFSTVYGQEWFIDTDANLVITDQGVFPLEAVEAVLEDFTGWGIPAGIS